MYVLVINQKNVSLGMSWLLVSTFLGNQPPKNRWSGKSPWIQSGPKKIRSGDPMAPEISERVMLAPQIDPAGDFRNMILWPVRRGLTFIEMVTWNKVRFCAEIRGFPFFLNSWISLDMLAQQISCVCVFIPRMAICGLELFPWGDTSVLTSLRHQTWHPWSR